MHLIYKQLSLYINLYIKKKHFFLFSNGYLYSIYIFQSRYAVVSDSHFHHQYRLEFVKHLINAYLLKKVYINNYWMTFNII